MFGNGKEAPKKSTGPIGGPTTSAGVNTIDEHTSIKGNIQAGGDIRIDGKLDGDLICKAKLIIGERGSITGDVDCQNAMIEGTFEGTIIVRDLLTLKDTARVKGNVRASKMAVGSGCLIDGQCTVTGDKDPAAGYQKASGSMNGKHDTAKHKSNGAAVHA